MPFGHDPGKTAKRCTYQRWFALQSGGDGDKIASEVGNVIGPVFGPFAVPVTSQVQCDRVKAMTCEKRGNPLPGAVGLSTAMRENDRHSIACAFDTSGNGKAGLTGQFDRFFRHDDTLL